MSAGASPQTQLAELTALPLAFQGGHFTAGGEWRGGEGKTREMGEVGGIAPWLLGDRRPCTIRKHRMLNNRRILWTITRNKLLFIWHLNSVQHSYATRNNYVRLVSRYRMFYNRVYPNRLDSWWIESNIFIAEWFNSNDNFSINMQKSIALDNNWLQTLADALRYLDRLRYC